MQTNQLIKIPLYFDDYNDAFKFNGVDKIFNKLLYNEDERFLDAFPIFLTNNFQKINRLYNKKYFYPVNLSYQYLHFFDQYTFNIPLNVIQDIKNKKCKILIINQNEGFEFSLYERLIEGKILNNYNLKYSDFILLTGNLLTTSKKGLKNIYINQWESIIDIYNEQLSQQLLNNIFSDNFRDYKFICLQRRPKAQRLMLYTELYDYRHEGILTMGTGDHTDNNIDMISQIEKYDFFNYKTLRKFQKRKLKNTLPCEYDAKLAIDNPTHDLQIEKYVNSYLHVVSETNFENVEDQIFFSEKIYKPMVFMQPFVLFSQAHSLQHLKSLGFKTFQSRYINEDYDNIEDNKERFFAALNQVKQIISMPKNYLHNMMREFSDILVHNHDNLKFRYYNNKTYYIELLKLLNYWN